MPVPILPAPVRTAWWAAHGTSWTLELRWLDRDMGLGPLADSISCRVPVTHSVTDTMAAELLAARGLWLFADSSGGPLTGSGHRVGAVSDDAQLIALAHRVHDDARHPGGGAPDNVGCAAPDPAPVITLTHTRRPQSLICA